MNYFSSKSEATTVLVGKLVYYKGQHGSALLVTLSSQAIKEKMICGI